MNSKPSQTSILATWAESQLLSESMASDEDVWGGSSDEDDHFAERETRVMQSRMAGMGMKDVRTTRFVGPHDLI